VAAPSPQLASSFSENFSIRPHFEKMLTVNTMNAIRRYNADEKLAQIRMKLNSAIFINGSALKIM